MVLDVFFYKDGEVKIDLVGLSSFYLLGIFFVVFDLEGFEFLVEFVVFWI